MDKGDRLKKEDLKNYCTGNFLQLLIMTKIKLIDVFPTPFLRVVLIGLVNTVWKEMTILRDMDKIEKHFYMKPDGKKSDFSEPTIKKIIHYDSI